MEPYLRRAALICATLLFTISGSHAAAQSAPDSSSQQSVPPAPPPDLRGATGPTSAAPRHRWVEMGGYLRPEARRKSPARSSPTRHAKAAPAHSEKVSRASKHATRASTSLTKAELRRCKALSHREIRRNGKCKAALQRDQKPTARKAPAVAAMSKAQTRRCRSMTYTQLLRNRECAALLQRELGPDKQARDHSRKGKIGKTKTRKATSTSTKRHQKTSRRHRS